LVVRLLLALLFPGIALAQQTLHFTVQFADPAGYNDITSPTFAAK
jgi:hypothetical protein